MNRLSPFFNKKFRNKAYNIAKYLIGWPVSVISLLYIGSIIYSNKSSFASVISINFTFLTLSILSFFVYFTLRALLWNEIIKQKGNKLSFKDTVYFWEISEIKRYTPGNVWSFLSRSFLFTQNNLSARQIFSSIVNEMGLIVISCLSISLFYIAGVLKNPVLINLSLILTLAVVLVYLYIGKLIRYIPNSKIFELVKDLILPSDNVFVNLKLFMLAVSSFAMFGIATYFSAISLFNLTLTNVTQFVSLFVFSLLVGYLSLITPMGLGVREGVMTFGLLSFLSASAAGLVSIFTRITFIVSEVIFLGITVLWVKTKNKLINDVETFILSHKHESVLAFLILLFFAYFTAAGFLRYDYFYTGRFDLGNMDQTVWNTIHGRIFQTTDPNGTDIISRLAYHADFILILISPLYFIWSNPKMLILLQVIVICFGALFAYLLGKEILKNKNFSLALSAAFLLYPAIQYNLLFDFHGVTLATTFLLATFYFFLKRKYLYFFVFAVLAGLTKEQIWSIVAIFGFAICFREVYKKNFKLTKEFIFGLMVFALGTSSFYILIWKVIPYFKGGTHFALSYFSDFGTTTSGVFLNILLNPLKTLSIILKYDNLVYYVQLLAPAGFLPLLAFPVLIFAVPDILINALSTNAQLHQIYYQYTSAITPFVFIAAIYGAKFVTERFRRVSFEMLGMYIVSVALISQYLIGPMPGTLKPNIDMFVNQISDAAQIEKFINSIPTKYSIAATNNLGSHLSRRQNIYTIPIGIDKADVILFLLNNGFSQQPVSTLEQTISHMEQDKRYVQVYKKGDFIVFEKRTLYSQPKPKKGEVNLFPYSIKALIDRQYHKSDITLETQVSSDGNFQSYIVSFDVDGLKEYSLMNVPNTPMPQNGYPVLILDHGYIPPNQYSTVDSYKAEADYFANHGFLVLKPDYRGNGNSELDNQALMRFEYPVDVLTLLASLGNVPKADLNNVFLWSHSMGGEVSLTVLEVISQDKSLNHLIKGAVFWAPVTDPVKWFAKNHLPDLEEATITPYPYTKTFQILGTPEDNPRLWESLSPLNFLNNINVPILLQHGTADTTVPYSWSVELDNDLKNLGMNVQFISYPNDNHNLPLHWSQAVSADLNFYNSLIK